MQSVTRSVTNAHRFQVWFCVHRIVVWVSCLNYVFPASEPNWNTIGLRFLCPTMPTALLASFPEGKNREKDPFSNFVPDGRGLYTGLGLAGWTAWEVGVSKACWGLVSTGFLRCTKRQPVCIKQGLRTVDYGLRTGYKIRTRYKTWTGKYGLGIIHGQGIKRGLQTADWV